MSLIRLHSFICIVVLLTFNGLYAGTVQGVVSDASTGLAISSAQIYAMGYSPDGADSVFYSDVSGLDGKYTLANMMATSYVIWCVHPDYQHMKVRDVAVSENATLTLDFALDSLVHQDYDTHVSGMVYSTPELLPVLIPLPGATITLYNSEQRFATHSNNDGFYAFNNIPPGDYNLAAVAPNHQPYQSTDLIILQTGSRIENLDINLIPFPYPDTSVVSGTISDLSDNSPVYPAYITLIPLYYFLAECPLPVEPQIYAVINNPDGSYMVENIPPGDYMMICSAQLYKWQRIETVNLTDQGATVDFFLEKLNPALNNLISGTIYEYPTKGLVLPLVNAYLTCTDPNLERPDILHYCLSDGFGHYHFYDLDSGLGDLQFSKPGYQLLADTLKISSDTWLTDQDYWMKPLSPPLFGHITGNVHFDQLNKPVAGASISFLPKYTDTTETDAVYQTVTDMYGNYEMLLPEDEYIVSCQYCGPDGWYFYQEYYDDVQSIADALPVAVKARDVVTGIDFGIPYPAIVSNVTFTGNVSDQEGNPLANALVNVHPYDLSVRVYDAADNVYQTWTDDQGNYVLEINLYWFTIPTPVLGFIVSACKDGYLTEFYQEKKTAYEADILWALSDTTFTAIDFTLDNVGEIQAISGTISSEAGGTIFQAFVIGVHAASGEVVFTVSNYDGSYLLSGLQKGYYFLLFVASGYIPEFYDDVHRWEEATPVWVEGVISDINAILTPMPVFVGNPNGIISGRIYDQSGNPLAGAMVTLQLRNGLVTGYSMSDNNGMFQIPWENAGEYQITISKVNYSSYAAWITVNTQEPPPNSLIFTLERTFTHLPDRDSSNEENTLPTAYRLYRNYPNPFNPLTHICFDLPDKRNVSLVIYDILGHPVRELLNSVLPAGTYTYTWDGTDQHGHLISSGIYFYVLQTPAEKRVGKMILQK
jgi:hypothetical protein